MRGWSGRVPPQNSLGLAVLLTNKRSGPADSPLPEELAVSMAVLGPKGIAKIYKRFRAGMSDAVNAEMAGTTRRTVTALCAALKVIEVEKGGEE